MLGRRILWLAEQWLLNKIVQITKQTYITSDVILFSRINMGVLPLKSMLIWCLWSLLLIIIIVLVIGLINCIVIIVYVWLLMLFFYHRMLALIGNWEVRMWWFHVKNTTFHRVGGISKGMGSDGCLDWTEKFLRSSLLGKRLAAWWWLKEISKMEGGNISIMWLNGNSQRWKCH